MRPAVAVMAKVPGLLPVKSRLQPALTPEMATLLYRCFLLDRLDALAALPEIEPVVAFTPPAGKPRLAAVIPPRFRLVPQEGRDLGERLSNLLAGLLAAGHAGAIAVDSDSPTLPMEHVSEAARTLAGGTADVVLGPTEDGGYYLVGLGQEQAALFDAIPWSTGAVLERTLERAAALKLRVRLLPRWFDVDTEPDLRRLQADLRGGAGGPARTRRCLRAIYE